MLESISFFINEQEYAMVPLHTIPILHKLILGVKLQILCFLHADNIKECTAENCQMAISNVWKFYFG